VPTVLLERLSPLGDRVDGTGGGRAARSEQLAGRRCIQGLRIVILEIGGQLGPERESRRKGKRSGSSGRPVQAAPARVGPGAVGSDRPWISQASPGQKFWEQAKG